MTTHAVLDAHLAHTQSRLMSARQALAVHGESTPRPYSLSGRTYQFSTNDPLLAAASYGTLTFTTYAMVGSVLEKLPSHRIGWKG